MNNVICECCYVVHGWIRSCNCTHGPTRSAPENPFGLAEPWFDTSMGRNEAICFDERREMNTPGMVGKDTHTSPPPATDGGEA